VWVCEGWGWGRVLHATADPYILHAVLIKKLMVGFESPKQLVSRLLQCNRRRHPKLISCQLSVFHVIGNPRTTAASCATGPPDQQGRSSREASGYLHRSKLYRCGPRRAKGPAGQVSLPRLPPHLQPSRRSPSPAQCWSSWLLFVALDTIRTGRSLLREVK